MVTYMKKSFFLMAAFVFLGGFIQADNSSVEWQKHGLSQIFDGVLYRQGPTADDLFLVPDSKFNLTGVDPEGGFVIVSDTRLINGTEFDLAKATVLPNGNLGLAGLVVIQDRAKFEKEAMSRSSKFVKERFQTVSAVTGLLTLLPAILLGGFLLPFSFPIGALIGAAVAAALSAGAGGISALVTKNQIRKDLKALPPYFPVALDTGTQVQEVGGDDGGIPEEEAPAPNSEEPVPSDPNSRSIEEIEI